MSASLLLTVALAAGAAWGALSILEEYQSLFARHVLGVTACVVLSSVGTALARARIVAGSRTVHAVVNGAAVAALLFGIYQIYQSKEAKAKPHLSTLHAYMGVATAAITLGASMGGSGGYNNISLPGVGPLIKVHRKFGPIAGAALVITFTSGFWKDFVRTTVVGQNLYAFTAALATLWLVAFGATFVSRGAPKPAKTA
jgi:hypothetical protein